MAKTKMNWLVNDIHDAQLSSFVAQYFSGRLLDIGCGKKPYANMVQPWITEHVGLDHEISPHGKDQIDLLGTAYEIPSQDQQFDSVLCTAVLEHLEEPEQAIRECYRVLRPGGVAIYSVPFIWHLHEEPRDFYRFSKYGLKYLFEKVGFELLELRPLSGFWVTFGQLLVYNIYRFDRGLFKRLKIVEGIGWCIQKFSWFLDRKDPTEKWTWMYMLVAQKPEEATADISQP